MSLDLTEQKPAISLREFEEVFTDFLAGHVSFAQLQIALGEVLDTQVDKLSEVQAQIDGAMQAGRLPEQSWEQLNRAIDQTRSAQRVSKATRITAMQAERSEPPVLTHRAAAAEIDAEITETPLADNLHASGAWAGNKVPAAAASGVHRIKTAKGTNQAKADEQLPPGTVLCDRYVLVSPSGKGNMGRVYKALDRRKKEAGVASPWVAVKLLNPALGSRKAAIKSLEQEAINGSKLDHPNLVRSFDFNQDGEIYFICMEWLEGETLRVLLDRAGDEGLAQNQGLRIIEALAQGLDHAHGKGVIHADIKPANVLLTQSGDIKLLDFGIARTIHTDSELAQARTTAYASCEVLEGQATQAIDDVFSLGVLAYRVLSGQRPFGAMNALEAEATQQRPAIIEGLPPYQWHALQEALAWRRSDRTPDVDSFIAGFFGHEEIVMETHDPLPVYGPDETDSDTSAGPLEKSPAPDQLAEVFAATGSTKSPESTAGPSSSIDSAPDTLVNLRKWRRPAIAIAIGGLVLAGAAAWLGQDKPNPDAAANNGLSEPRIVPTTETTVLEEVSVSQVARIGPADLLPPADEVATATPGISTTASVPITQAQNADETMTEEPSGQSTYTPGTELPATAAITQAIEETNQSAQVAGPGSRVENASAAPSSPAAKTETQLAAVPAADAGEKLKETAAATPQDTTLPSINETKENVLTSEQISAVASLPLATTEPLVAEATTDPAMTVADGNEQLTEVMTTNAAAPEKRADIDSQAPSQEPVIAPSIEMAMVTPDQPSELPESATPAEQTTGSIDISTPEKSAPPAELTTPAVETLPLSAFQFARYVEPRIPRRAVARGLTGWVDLEFNITATGETIDIVVVGAEPPEVFTKAALRAVERWQFKPRIVAGEMVPSRSNVRLRFE